MRKALARDPGVVLPVRVDHTGVKKATCLAKNDKQASCFQKLEFRFV